MSDVVYKGLILKRGTRLHELYQKKDLALVDNELKEINNRQKQHLARYYKLPEENALWQQALECYGLN